MRNDSFDEPRSSLPANRARTTADWLFAAVGSRPSVQFGFVPGAAVSLDTAAPESTRR